MIEICSMHVLVIAATESEIAPFIAQNKVAEYLITGVGVPACLYQLVKKIQLNKYDAVIQAGIAGSFNPGILLGETVLVQKDIFADLGIFEKDELKNLFDVGLAEKNETPYKDGWLINENKFLQQSTLKKTTAITINTVGDDKKIINQYVRKYHADIESMEGAAFHYGCLQEKIPFIQLRSISNKVGERDKLKWKMNEAITQLNIELGKLFAEVSNQQSVVNS